MADLGTVEHGKSRMQRCPVTRFDRRSFEFGASFRGGIRAPVCAGTAFCPRPVGMSTSGRACGGRLRNRRRCRKCRQRISTSIASTSRQQADWVDAPSWLGPRPFRLDSLSFRDSLSSLLSQRPDAGGEWAVGLISTVLFRCGDPGFIHARAPVASITRRWRMMG